MRDGAVSKETNHSGGTLGGMTDGSPLNFQSCHKSLLLQSQLHSTP